MKKHTEESYLTAFINENDPSLLWIKKALTYFSDYIISRAVLNIPTQYGRPWLKPAEKVLAEISPLEKPAEIKKYLCGQLARNDINNLNSHYCIVAFYWYASWVVSEGLGESEAEMSFAEQIMEDTGDWV